MHKLIISTEEKKTKIMLDNFELKDVSEYNVKSSAAGTTELTVKLIINNSDVIID